MKTTDPMLLRVYKIWAKLLMDGRDKEAAELQELLQEVVILRCLNAQLLEQNQPQEKTLLHPANLTLDFPSPNTSTKEPPK